MTIDLTENKDPMIISENAIAHLRETSRWSKFLAILGFVICGLLILVGLFASVILSDIPSMNPQSAKPFPGFMFGLLYVVIAALYAIPCYYLFQFSTKMKAAIQQRDGALLESAFRNQKSLFKFMGILTIAIICLYIVIGIVAGIAFMKLPSRQ